MRVALVHNFHRPVGGAEVFVHETRAALEAAGVETSIFTPADEDAAREPWARHYPPAPEYLRGSVLHKATTFPGTVYSTMVRRRFAAFLREVRPDVVHAFAVYTRLTPAVLLEARSQGVPVVMSCNDYKHICPNYKLYHHGRICEDCRGGRFYYALLNRCMKDNRGYSAAATVEAYVHEAIGAWKRCVDRFLFASQFMRDTTARFWGATALKSHIVRNPFDISKIPFDAAVPAESCREFVYFGRLVEEKGVGPLIRAVACNPDIRLSIVGDGELREPLEQLARERTAVNVRFLGSRWGRDLYEVLAHARVVVVPSIWHENFPYAVLQAMAMGRPVIASRRGGLPELVRDGDSGLLFDPDDPGSLQTALRRLRDSDTLVAGMSARARALVSQGYSHAEYATQLQAIYAELS